MRIRESTTLFYDRKRHPLRGILAAAVILAVLMCLYVLYDNGRISVREQNVYISDLPAELEGFTVTLVSDLNGRRFGPQNEQLAEEIKRTGCSAVLCLGDMVGKGGNAQPFLELLEQLDTPVFFIEGDCDPPALESDGMRQTSALADWVNSAQLRGAVYLNAPASITYKNQTVWFSPAYLLGIDWEQTMTAYEQSAGAGAAYRADSLRRAREASDSMHSQQLHIVASHEPLEEGAVSRILSDRLESVSGWMLSADLLVCGGTCAGQWHIPFAGGVYYRDWFPGAEALSPFRRIVSFPCAVTGGLSASGSTPLPAFRLFNTPQITKLVFTSVYSPDAVP